MGMSKHLTILWAKAGGHSQQIRPVQPPAWRCSWQSLGLQPMKPIRTSAAVLIGLLLVAPPLTRAQVVSDFPVCVNYRERYEGGGYDAYGNYVPGVVTTERYNVDCGGALNGSGTPRRYIRGNPLNPSCNPTRTILAGTLGAGIGATFNRSARRYTIPIGAAVFGLAYAC